ncbi:MAG: GNAT family N-acetyltransferase [Acidimicrobiia bacterium]
MVLSDCFFATDRLVADDWTRLLIGDTAERERDAFVASLLTDAVTRDLPPGWQGPYDVDRAASWFGERQEESTVLLVVDRSDARPVGLLILSPSDSDDGRSDIRLGYIFEERSWGKGLATELVGGLADWCRPRRSIRTLIGGVADGNAASAHVLRKNGFVPDDPTTDNPSHETMFRLSLPS